MTREVDMAIQHVSEILLDEKNDINVEFQQALDALFDIKQDCVLARSLMLLKDEYDLQDLM